LRSLWPDDNDSDPAASTRYLVAASLVTAMAVTQVVLVATLVVFAWR
jgi:hypothetical protein